MALSVFIIDGHPAVGRGLCRLRSTVRVIVRGLSTDAEDGLARAIATHPDVVLVDAELPDEAGGALIRRLRARLPATRVVALGIYPRWRALALAAGADTFLLKDAGYDALHAAINGDDPPLGHIAKDHAR